MIQFIKKIIHLVFIFFSFTGYTYLSADIRPQALKAKENCELWVGTASGNDPSVQIELSLCRRGKKDMAGVLQWSSIKSGWNKRAVNGYKDESKSMILLQDKSFIENKPKKGWMFCLIDEYVFSIENNTLQGTYYSKACNDRAKLLLYLKMKK